MQTELPQAREAQLLDEQEYREALQGIRSDADMKLGLTKALREAFDELRVRDDEPR